MPRQGDLMDLTRRSFLFTAASALLLVHLPAEAREVQTPNEAWLGWVLERMGPGVLIGVMGKDRFDVRYFIAEVMRAKGNKVVYREGVAVQDLKKECLQRGLPSICGINERDIQFADVVLELDGDTLTLVKHRWGPLTDGP